MRRVLVTGAQGFVGREVVAELVSKGFEVTAFARSTSGQDAAHVRAVRGDITDRRAVERALEGAEAVVHLAARLSDEPDSYRVNVGGTQNLIDACKKAGVRHIVYMSTASVKIPRGGIYASTKKEAEELLRASSITTTILRPSIIYGDLFHGVFASVAKSSVLPLVPVFGSGRWLSRPVHVFDVARMVGIALVQKKVEGNTYDVGGPDTLSFNELIAMISRELFERRPRIVHVPVSLGMGIASVLRFCMKKPPLTASNILGSTQDIPWDGETCFNDFGFVPRSFPDGLREVRAEEEKKEADVLFSYLYSRSGFRYTPSLAMRERYARACAANGIGPAHSLLRTAPALIGPVDAATKILRPHSEFQRRMLLAGALVETEPQSARWLLPRRRSVASASGKSFLLLCSAFLKIVSGLFLTLIPGFLSTYGR